MQGAVTEKERYTYEDYLNIADDKRYELIEGGLIMVPAPVTYHQKISRELEFELLKFVKENNLGEVFDAPCDVVLSNENVVQPDILFISKERLNIIGEKNIQGPPDLVIEIVSEDSAYRDMIQKKKLYAQSGVSEFWLVIPKEKEIEIYTLEKECYQLFKRYGEKDTLKSHLLKELRIELKRIF